MKKLSFLLIAAMTITFLSCNKEETPPIQDNDIIGVWRMNSVTINGIDGNDITPNLNGSTIMNIASQDNFYYRNYVTGNWSLDADQLTLNSQWTNTPWEYTIDDLTANEMTVTISLTEAEYNYDFPQFNSTDVLEIVEVYAKE